MIAPTPGTWRSAHDVSKVRFAVPYLGVTRITGIFREHHGALTKFRFNLGASFCCNAASFF